MKFRVLAISAAALAIAAVSQTAMAAGASPSAQAHRAATSAVTHSVQTTTRLAHRQAQIERAAARQKTEDEKSREGH